ncbi:MULTISPECIES: ABC transporter substrate-binding protein [unclassified Phenylobacterium]|uniref:ABC transporter substrate-binding protein n=1 Tax=unclassified Phenylobacterium TaxID=2640670 RepID=UPI00083AC8A5|nr:MULTISPECIES: ABC transporter substrate-binding protein [unclassified Phenylobacterium]
MRRALRIAAIALAAALSSETVAAKPQRILSMNQCTDLLVLQLVPKARIAGVTYLARDGARSLFPGAADGIAVNYGTPEDIIRFRPDLILSGDFSLAVTRRLAREVGAPIVEVKGARSFDDVRQALRQVGAAVGEPARAEALVRRMDAQLASLAAHPPPRPVRVVAWDGGATVPGTDTFANRIFAAAGAVNIAARPGAIYTSFDVERLLAANPEALLFGGDGRPLLQNDEAQHRVVRRIFAGRRIPYPEAAFNCGLPQSAAAAVELRRRLDALPPRHGSSR